MDSDSKFKDIIIDQEEIASGTLKVSEHGRKTGMENLPPSVATSPCDNEKHIQRYHERLAAETRERFEEEQLTIGQERTERLGEVDVAKAKEPRSVAHQLVVELQTKFSDDIKRAAKDRNRSKRRLAALKDQGIDASNTAVGSYSLVLGALFFFLIVEALANSYFIGQGSDYGLLGGAIEAFFIASISIVISFSAGIGCRAIFGKGWLRRTLAVIAGLCYGAALVFYHTLIGWYRASLVYGNPDTAVSDALTNFTDNGLALPDLYSYGLAIVGLFFAGVAFVAGIKGRDARLASLHGRIAEKFNRAETKLRKLEHSYLTGVNQVYMGQIDEVEKRQKAADVAGHHLRVNFAKSKWLGNSYKNMVDAIRHSYIYSVERFRVSNQAVRSIHAPCYFANEPAPLEVPEIELDRDAKYADQVDELERCLKAFHAVANEERDLLREDYKACLKKTPAFLAQLRSAEYHETDTADSSGHARVYGDKSAMVDLVPMLKQKEAGNVYT
jgi:hypothetical protein